MGADAGFCNGKDSESLCGGKLTTVWLKSLDGHTPLVGWEWVGGKGAPLMLWLRQCPPPDAGAGCASQRRGAGAGGGLFLLIFALLFYYHGAGGFQGDRAARGVAARGAGYIVAGQQCGVYCDQRKGREGKPGKGSLWRGAS